MFLIGFWDRNFITHKWEGKWGATLCSIETVKNYLLIVWARKQPIKWEKCPFLNLIRFYGTPCIDRFLSQTIFSQSLVAMLSQYCLAQIPINSTSLMARKPSFGGSHLRWRVLNGRERQNKLTLVQYISLLSVVVVRVRGSQKLFTIF